MPVTEDWGLPYPECSPPLRKDAADIAQVRDLAVAMNDNVQDLYDRLSDILLRPAACRMSVSVVQNGTGTTIRPFYDVNTFDNTPGVVMADTVNGAIRIPWPGWWLVGAWWQSTSAVYQGYRTRFIKDGSPAASPAGPANIINANNAYMSLSQTIRYDAEGTLGTEMIATSSTTWQITSRVFALQLAKF